MWDMVRGGKGRRDGGVSGCVVAVGMVLDWRLDS